MSSEENPDRPLSSQGRSEIQKVGSFLSRSRFNISGVIHSDKLRTQETALILSKALNCGQVVQESSFPIGPNDEVGPLCDAIKNTKYKNLIENKMIVGHLPYLGKLLSKLLFENENKTIIDFEPGMVLSIKSDLFRKEWVIEWVFKPSLLGS